MAEAKGNFVRFPTPMCRNGHGELTMMESTAPNWVGLRATDGIGFYLGGQPRFIVRAYSCAVCGYVEFQDVHQSEFDRVAHEELARRSTGE